VKKPPVVYVDVEGLAKLLNCKPKAIRYQVEKARLPYFKREGRVLFDPDQVQRVLAKRTVQVVSEAQAVKNGKVIVEAQAAKNGNPEPAR
jgi:hypothetical protein